MIIAKNLNKFKKYTPALIDKIGNFGVLRKNFSEENEEIFEPEDFSGTGLKIQKSNLTDYRRSRFFDVRLRNEGEIFVPKELSDDMHLLMRGVVIDHDPLSAFYAMEVNGRIFHVFNAERYPYGKMINKIAKILNGKQRPTYRNDRVELSDMVVVLNANKTFMRSTKMKEKDLVYHSGYVGGLKKTPFRTLVFDRPEMLYTWAVLKQLPKNKLSKEKVRNLMVYRDQEHDWPGILPKFAERIPKNREDYLEMPTEVYEGEEPNTYIVTSKKAYEDNMVFLHGKSVTIDPNFKPPNWEEIRDYEFTFTKGDQKEVSKKFKRWIRKAKTKRDWRPKRVYKQAPLMNNEIVDFHLFKSDKEIKKYGYDDIFEELEEKDVQTL